MEITRDYNLRKRQAEKDSSKHLKTKQVWFLNGQFQLEPAAILTLEHFWPPFCCNHLKTGPEIEWPFNFRSRLDHFIAIKLTI